MTDIKEKDSNRYLIRFIFAMAVFGTIGIFRRFIPLDSGLLAMIRGFIGCAFILVFLAVRGTPFSFVHFHGKWWILVISGAIMGFNWITLFEAYNYTSIATASLCYYMAPVFLIIVSPILFKERITLKKAVCVIAAFAGMILVSGILGEGVGMNDLRGVIFGLVSAVLYAAVISISKLVSDVDPYEKTALQLFSAAVAVIPYLLIKGVFTEPSLASAFTPLTILMLAVVCLFHTGFTYLLYFGAVDKLKLQQVAIFSYVDPVVSIILSQFILHEDMGVTGIIGAVLILGAAIVSEL